MGYAITGHNDVVLSSPHGEGMFCRDKQGCIRLSKDIFQVPHIKDRRLLPGWCKGDPAYLAAELPNVS